MKLIQVLVGVLCIVVVSSEENAISDTCDRAEQAQLAEKFEKVLGQLPRDFVGTNTGDIEPIPKVIFLGNTTVGGLFLLRTDRPPRTFCRGDDRVTVFSISSSSPVRISIPWRLCSGHNGTIYGHAVHLRYKGEMITNNVGGVATSRIQALTPVLTENFFVDISGAGPIVGTAVSVLSHILYGPVRLYWVEVMTTYVQEALIEALKKLG